MFRGLQLFKIREDEYFNTEGIELPPIYKCFIRNFVVNKNSLKKFDYLDPRFNSQVEMLERKYIPDEGRLVIYNFLSIDEGLNVMKRSFDKDDEINKMDFLPIAECATDQYLLLGLGDSNKDLIVLEDRFSNERFITKAENIIDFVNGIEMVFKEEINGIPVNKFYRNLVEDFWRVKNSENES